VIAKIVEATLLQSLVIERRVYRYLNCLHIYCLVTTGNGNTKMATEKDEDRKKLQITERLQKREEERLQNIQQRKIVKEDESTIHVCGL